MSLSHRGSLEFRLDTLAEAQFIGAPLPATARAAAVRWIVGRQGQPGSYADMFAPTADDLQGIRLFTGEVVRSFAGIGHLLGEEACRVLAALPSRDRATQGALDRAVVGMAARLDEAERRGGPPGTYCCGTCTSGYWRNLANGLLPRAEARLRSGLDDLHEHRIGDGTWRRYPFFHTSLALTEIGPGLAKAELQYAAARWRRILTRLERRADDTFARRRAVIGRRLLAQSNS